MGNEEPSGQQTVEHCPRCGSVVENAAGIGPFCPNAKCDVADNLLCVPTFSTAAPTAPSTVLSDAHAKAADEAWLKAEGGIMEAIHATFAAGYEAVVNERAAAPSTAAGERERLEEERNRLSNHFGYGARLDGSTRERIAAIDARLAALATPPAQAPEEPDAWIYETGDDGSGWRREIDYWKPPMSQYFRNARPLYAHPPSPSVPWEEQAAQIRRDALEEAARICRDEAMMCRRDMLLASAMSAETCAHLIRALLSKPAKGVGE